MKKTIQKYNIDEVWHFTDESNLDVIKKHNGLFSFAELKNRGIKPPRMGGNDVSRNADMLNNVDRYVHLAFCDDHPMLYWAKQDQRIPNPVWLKIDSSVLLGSGVLFPDCMPCDKIIGWKYDKSSDIHPFSCT